jgi:hypothetical protein
VWELQNNLAHTNYLVNLVVDDSLHCSAMILKTCVMHMLVKT